MIWLSLVVVVELVLTLFCYLEFLFGWWNRYNGNSFTNSPAPPPPPYTPPPHGRSGNNRSRSPAHETPGSVGLPSSPKDENGKKGLKAGPLVGIVLGSSVVAFLALIALVFCLRKAKRKEVATRPSTGSVSASTGQFWSFPLLCILCVLSQKGLLYIYICIWVLVNFLASISAR